MFKCFSPELECSGGVLTVLTSGFFLGELFCVSCGCWPGLRLFARGDLLQDRADCPFFMSGDVIGKLKEL